MTLKCCTQYASKFGNSAVATGQEKLIFIPITNKGNTKQCSNYHTIALISHATKVILKILQVRLKQYVNQELPDVQNKFRKGRGTRDHIANIYWITEKAREFQQMSTFASMTTLQSLLCGSQQTVENS